MRLVYKTCTKWAIVLTTFISTPGIAGEIQLEDMQAKEGLEPASVDRFNNNTPKVSRDLRIESTLQECTSCHVGM